jgi:hypothetical protein
MPLRVLASSMETIPLELRMPFGFGITTVTSLKHVIVRLELEIDGKRQAGFAADHLVPKWFTKDPQTSIADDEREMRAVIQSACGLAEQAGAALSVFDLWRRVYDAQENWARDRSNCPRLLWNFGVTFIERAAIDAFCRATDQNFAEAVRSDALGFRLGDIHHELSGARIADFLPPQPSQSIIVRHTVGLSDPLTGSEIDDGLPRSLQACAQRYGLTHFKIKLSGEVDQDVQRIHDIAEAVPQARLFTLDGNENYQDVSSLRDFWRRVPRERVLFVEQPLHRDVALSDATAEEMRAWDDRPRMIIDESDDSLDSSAHALRAGYSGVSYKSCKGVFKGIANACLMKRCNAIISAEDLSTIGPVSLLQDLAVIATLGIPHAERNGHHYFRGLSAFPRAVQQQVLADHGDLYQDIGFPSLRIVDGAIRLDSVARAPFGYARFR